MKDPQPWDMIRLSELIGQSIAVRVVDSKEVSTRYGPTTAYMVEYATLDMSRPVAGVVYSSAFSRLDKGEWYAAKIEEGERGYRLSPCERTAKTKLYKIVQNSKVEVREDDIPF
jgi:SH3-like domain-containing protein